MKRLPADEDLVAWIEEHVDPADRLSAAPFVPESPYRQVAEEPMLARQALQLELRGVLEGGLG